MDAEISVFATALDADEDAEWNGGPGGVGGATFETEIVAVLAFDVFEDSVSFGVCEGYFVFF